MFGFLKRKQREVFAPVDGQVVALEEVEDEVLTILSKAITEGFTT